MFSQVEAVSPIQGQPFLWMAEYFDGSLTEFDLKTAQENNFKLINKEKLVRFGLIGNKRKMWFECVGGTFNIVGRRIDIMFETEDGRVLPLTGVPKNYMNDVITFKKAVADVNLMSSKEGKAAAPRITGFYFGYKSQLDFGDISLAFKPIVSLPLSKAAFVQVNLVANKDISGRLIFLVNKQKYETPIGKLAEGKTSQINWVIK